MFATFGSTAVLAALMAPARVAEERPDAAWTPGNEVTSPVSPSVDEDRESSIGDGVYGRFDGDVDLGLHGGAQVAGNVAAAAGLTAHYFFMAGVFGRYTDGLGNDDWRLSRTISFGVDLRPAFVPRWGLDLGTGVAMIDLVVDSISLELGAYFADASGSFGDERGFEGSLGLGIPFMGMAEGPWLDARGIMRWRDPDSASVSADAALLVALSWHWLIALR
jgi:hypothetical protein